MSDEPNNTQREPGLIERLGGMPLGRKAERGTRNAELATGSRVAGLVASPFTLVDLPCELKPALTDEEKRHLEFCRRHGFDAHKVEVVELMEKFDDSGDKALLDRAIAILEHRKALEVAIG